ncbi:Pre-mRNA-splicing factor sap61, partial [Tieghemiomyces parasiticus]
GVGRYLDLHEQHEQYANLKDVPKLDYLAYLGELDNFAAIPRASKNQAYRDYLASLQTYLEDYFTRALPLFDVARCRSAAATDFDTRWTEHRVRGWETSEADQLQELFPLYCLACRKQYSKQTVYDAHLKSRKHQKAAKALEQTGQRADDPAAVRQAQRATLAELDAKDRAVAWQECLIAKYLEALGEKREDTRANVERKQALTEEERNAEVQEEDVDVDQYESDDNEPIYNPLKLPLGWDGKPIPYWLYKLHGLSHNYDCEICGDYTYRGRKDFDRHFTEWRHVHGLRCLGIPPGDRAFIGITRIEDAVRLWDKMKAGRKSEKNQTEHIEEFEDSEGNVFSKKTYEDLKRQGLI